VANVNLRNITNSFLDVRLASLASWRQAAEFNPRDRGGPYVVLQEGYDPEDPKVIAEEFVLGRSGKWLSLGLFYRLPVPERRSEYIFGTVAEVMQMMQNLPSKVQILRPATPAEAQSAGTQPDEMAAALQAGKNQPPGTSTPL
jgi:hypothetical protein